MVMDHLVLYLLTFGWSGKGDQYTGIRLYSTVCCEGAEKRVKSIRPRPYKELSFSFAIITCSSVLGYRTAELLPSRDRPSSVLRQTRFL